MRRATLRGESVVARKVAWGPRVTRRSGGARHPPAREPPAVSDSDSSARSSPPLASAEHAPSDAGPSVDSALGEPTLAEAWRRSAAVLWLAIFAVAAFALAFRWSAIESAFDARRLFR